ncbi:SpoIIE family protein phosphatase [Kineococcus gynurae]|uniref:SpoIIE family protein phosphatase n=1 Tax=Kineococcus gynurae TaxID=452979 RepID=A0ABV5LSQ5_9ACTN
MPGFELYGGDPSVLSGVSAATFLRASFIALFGPTSCHVLHLDTDGLSLRDVLDPAGIAHPAHVGTLFGRVTRVDAPAGSTDETPDPLLGPGEQSWAYLPVLGVAGPLGLLRLGFTRLGGLGPDEQDRATALLEQYARTVEENVALRDAARAERRFRALAGADVLDVFTTLGDALTARPGIPPLTSDLPGWRALAGHDDDSTPVDWLTTVHPADLAVVQDSWNFGRATGSRVTCRFRIRTREGWRWLSAVAVPVREPGADPTDPTVVTEWVGSLTDVTETVRSRRRNRALQQLAVSMAEAEDVPSAAEAIIAAVVAGTGARRGLLVLHNPVAGRLVVHSDDLRLPHLLRQSRISVAEHAELVDVLARRGGLTLTADSAPEELDPVPDVLRRQFALAAGQGEVAWRLTPLELRGRPLGTLTLGFSDGDLEGDDDAARAFEETVRRQIASGLDRLLLLESERSTAHVLQEALQPGPLPDVPWLHAVRATSTATGHDVGGDWAEIIALDDDLVAVVLGDVMGRGAHAATVMGEVRTMVRTLAVVDPHPTAVLQGLDACLAAIGGDDLVTLFYGLLSSEGRLLAASAGHIPPLTCSGGIHYLDLVPGLPLGVPGDLREDVLEEKLVAGAGLLVFSDGLVETRTRGLTEGMDAVLSIFSSEIPPSTEALVEGLMTRMAEADEVDDDVTLLALRYLPPGFDRTAQPAP